MKRFLSILISLCVIAIMMLSLVSCDNFDFNSIFNFGDFGDNDNNDSGHQHTYERKWTTNATHHWHEATCSENDGCDTAKGSYAEHNFKLNKCTVCYAIRECNHVYDDNCDDDCNICEAKREPPHEYDNSCDNICNVCFAERKASHTPEADDHDCTTPTYCSVCDAIVVEATGGHVFTTACDTTCNVPGCNHKRETTHTYTDVCDADCNSCGFKRVPDHSYSTTNICDKCNYGSKGNPKELKIPATLTFRYLPAENPAPVWYKFTTTSTVTIKITLSQNTIMSYGTDTESLTSTNGTDTVFEYTLEKETTYYVTFITANSQAADISAEVKCYKPATMTEWPLYGKEIVNLGDSIFGTYVDDTSLSNKIHLASGATTYNCGFGGTRAHPRNYGSTHIHFDMGNLIEAIISKNFEKQEATFAPTNEFGDIFDKRYPVLLETLKSVDFNDQIITLNHGTNDWTSATNIEDYKTSLSYVVTRLKENYPNAQIVLLSPTWRCTFDEKTGEYVPGGRDTEKINGKTNYDFLLAMKEVAEEMDVDFIDCYDIGINADNCYDYFPVNDKGIHYDGTHHNEAGREYLAAHITKELAKIVD